MMLTSTYSVIVGIITVVGLFYFPHRFDFMHNLSGTSFWILTLFFFEEGFFPDAIELTGAMIQKIGKVKTAYWLGSIANIAVTGTTFKLKLY